MVPRVIICDDEPLMVNILAEFCKDTGIVEVIRLKARNISRGIIKEKPWEIPFKYAYAVMYFQVTNRI